MYTINYEKHSHIRINTKMFEKLYIIYTYTDRVMYMCKKNLKSIVKQQYVLELNSYKGTATNTENINF